GPGEFLLSFKTELRDARLLILISDPVRHVRHHFPSARSATLLHSLVVLFQFLQKQAQFCDFLTISLLDREAIGLRSLKRCLKQTLRKDDKAGDHLSMKAAERHTSL